ncbi:MAG: hypothetical protein IKS94_00615 [Prevotella sp.]|nr:hypothetical protein [Prevotella sp.]
MKRTFFIATALFFALSVFAQDGTAFKGKIVNDEYQIWIEMDFDAQAVIVPEQEIFGEVAGYLGAKRDPRKWIVTSVEMKNKTTARLEIVNDYGSEDLTATLTLNSDGTFTLKQLDGSTIKIAVNKKWVKLPKTLVFKRQDD